MRLRTVLDRYVRRPLGRGLPPVPGSSASVHPSAEVELLLRQAAVCWLATSDADGRPALVPTWFWWDGETFRLFAKPGQRKLANLRHQPTVMLAIGEALDDFAVQLVEGEAELPSGGAELPPAMRAKYGPWLARLGIGWDEYAATYRQPIVIRPRRFLPWRGRSHGAPAPSGAAVMVPTLAAQPLALG